MKAELSLGPVLFNWKPETWRDFYYEMADTSSVADVYIGEVVCSKRQPFFERYIPDVIDRLEKAGKNVILSSLAVVMNGRESRLMRDLCVQTDYPVEANDISAHGLMKEKPHIVGPMINVYNEATLKKLAQESAVRFCLPQELPEESIRILAKAAKVLKTEVEIQVFGRVSLALSGRCYHARLHNLSRDSCQFVCAADADGLSLRTLDGKDFLAINGVQTLSHTYLALMPELAPLAKTGVTRFRLSPHSRNMPAIAQLFHDVLKGKKAAAEGFERLKRIMPDAAFSNGFYHGLPGYAWREA